VESPHTRCHPGFIPGSRATRKSLSFWLWTPQQVRGDTLGGRLYLNAVRSRRFLRLVETLPRKVGHARRLAMPPHIEGEPSGSSSAHAQPGARRLAEPVSSVVSGGGVLCGSSATQIRTRIPNASAPATKMNGLGVSPEAVTLAVIAVPGCTACTAWRIKGAEFNPHAAPAAASQGSMKLTHGCWIVMLL